MAELVKVLTETSLDNLFVLAGLAFSALAVLGNVSGKFEMGKNGRIIAGLLGPCLIAGGLWMHSDHGLRITSLGIVTQKTAFNGPCPVRIPLQGVIDGTGTGAAIYTFELSDGTETPAVRLEFARSDSKLVDGVWEVSSSLNNGWARLKTLAPHEELSKEQASFTVNCGQARGSDATVATIRLDPPSAIAGFSGDGAGARRLSSDYVDLAEAGYTAAAWEATYPGRPRAVQPGIDG